MDFLTSKREITRFRILVEVAENQPAVSQTEIANAIGLTPQAVSEHISNLSEEGLVDKLGRGRYKITKEGADVVLSRAEDLESFVEHVTDEVVGRVFVDTAVADGSVREGDEVSLRMQDGLLHAVPEDNPEPPKARAVTDAEQGEDVGVAEFDGIIQFDPGGVRVVRVPSVEDGGSASVDIDALAETVDQPVFALGTEAVVALRNAEVDHQRYAVAEGVVEAARNGVSSTVVAVKGRVGVLTDELGAENIEYDIVDAEVLDDGEEEGSGKDGSQT
ncbi:MAG: winged helix-turn-helix transcriptional regulator [Halobacteriales archaeon]